ncbi:MAG: hypothetical protein FJ291_20520 [Planctomycetes bacterium]|nr:hypothetical protein [Planctomycetota bacterium]
MDTERLPPQNEGAERAVLGAMILDNACVASVRAMLRPDDFYSPGHQALCAAIYRLADGGAPVDTVTLPAELERGGALDKVGGAPVVVGLFEDTPAAANAEYYARIVADRSVRRQLIRAGTDLARASHDLSADPGEAMAEAECAMRQARATGLDLDKDGLPVLAERAKALLEGTGELWSSGMPLLDGMIGGLTAGTTLVVGGRTRNGKTALSVGMMLATVEAGRRVLNVRYEEIPEGIVLRMASRMSGIPYADAQMRRLSDEGKARFREAIESVGDLWKDRLTIRHGERIEQIEARAEAAEVLRNAPEPLPCGPFSVIVADPPWPYETRAADATHRAAMPYPDMSLEEIRRLPVEGLAAEDSILWLWTTNAHLPVAFSVAEAWGFTYKTLLTWVKDHMGAGDWLRGQTEQCLMCVRGRPIVTLTNQTTALDGERREHSRKPESFYRLVEALCPGPKVELFARQERTGWASWGAEKEAFGPC